MKCRTIRPNGIVWLMAWTKPSSAEHQPTIFLESGCRWIYHPNATKPPYFVAISRSRLKAQGKLNTYVIFIARRVCIARTIGLPSQVVCLSVRLSYAGILSTPLNSICLPSGSPTILVFTIPNGIIIFRREPPPLTGASNARGYEKITIFDQYLALSRKWCKIEP